MRLVLLVVAVLFTLVRLGDVSTAVAQAVAFSPENSGNSRTNPNCPLGYYCSNGMQYLCPAGTYGNEHGLSDDSCSGSCGFMWASGSGELRCTGLSTGGDVIIFLIMSGIIGIVVAGVSLFKSKAAANNWWGRNFWQRMDAADEFEAEVREIRQKQIRASVEALATRVVKQSFPSVLALSSSLMQFNVASAEQVNSGIKLAQKELAQHIKSILLQHPRLQFDDATYPANLPLWAEVDPTSEDGAQEIHSVSNSLAFTIRTAVENDLLDWFRRNQQQGEETGYDESQQGLLSGAAAVDAPSRWPSVDSELKIALRSVLTQSSWCKCLEGGRMAYSQLPLRPLLINGLQLLLRLSFDILVLVACYVCIRGDTLITVEVPFALSPVNSVAIQPYCISAYGGINQYPDLRTFDPYRFKISWNEWTRPSQFDPFRWFPWATQDSSCGFSFFRNQQNVQNGEYLFGGMFDQCSGHFGRIYRNILIFTSVCYWIAILPVFFSLCDTVLQLTPFGRGLSLAAIKVGERLQRALPRDRCAVWFLEGGGAITIVRSIGTLAIMTAVGLYTTACVARLNNAPAYVETQRFSPTSVALLEYTVVMGGALIVSLVAAALALISTAFALHHSYNNLDHGNENNQQAAPAQQRVHQQQQPPQQPENNQQVELQVSPPEGARFSDEGIPHVAASQIQPLEAIQKDHSVAAPSVTVHTQVELPVTVQAYPVTEGEADV